MPLPAPRDNDNVPTFSAKTLAVLALPPHPRRREFSGKNEARLVPGPGFDYGAGHEGRTRDIYLGKVALYH